MKRLSMVINGCRLLKIVPFVGMFFMDCIGHGSCKRTIDGAIKTDILTSSLYAQICRDYGDGYGSSCDTNAVDTSGKYELKELLIDPQDDCSNGCEKNNTLPVKMKVKIYKPTENGDSVLAEKVFTCEDDYTFSGDDITLPDIVW